MAQELRKELDEVTHLPVEELKVALLPALTSIRSYGIPKSLQEMPDMLSKILRRLLAVGIARFAIEEPEVTEKLMDFLWECVGVAAEKSEELKPAFEMVNRLKTGGLSFNFEASDSPLRSHFRMSQGKLSGGSGMLHFEDQDIRFMGSTADLVGVLTGEAELRKLMREGHPGLAPIIRPIMLGISNIVVGKAVTKFEYLTVDGSF